ncbi:MAG: hypothetical protein ABJH05_16190 [Fulvivirga sp.]
MKRTTLMVAMLLVVATAFATEKDKPNPKKVAKKTVAVMNNSPQKFKLVYLEQAKGLVKVSLKNAQGQIVHAKAIKNKEGFAQPYDLSELPNGEYTFKVINPDGSEVEETVTLEKPSNEPNFAANVLNVNDAKKFRLAVVNKDETALPTSIKLYDAKGNLIHEDKVQNLYGFRKIYDLSEVEGDSFRFSITNASGTKSMLAE